MAAASPTLPPTPLCTSSRSALHAAAILHPRRAAQLAAKYYQGLVQAPLKRTGHQWGIKGRPPGGGSSTAALVADRDAQRAEARAAARAEDHAERRKWRGEQKVRAPGGAGSRR